VIFLRHASTYIQFVYKKNMTILSKSFVHQKFSPEGHKPLIVSAEPEYGLRAEWLIVLNLDLSD
jgi:hypothetical protein